MKLQKATPSPRHREETILSSQQCSQQQQQQRQEGSPDSSFPAVLGREASNVQSIFRQASAKLGFTGRGTGSSAVRDDGHHHPGKILSAAADNHHATFAREKGQDEEKAGDVNDSTRPTKPAIARTGTLGPRGKRTALLGPRSSGGNSGNSPIRQLSRLLGFGGGSGSSGSSSAAAVAVAALPWQAYEGVSESLNYRPRGHGREFAESYDVGKILGSGGFAAVLAGVNALLMHSKEGRATNPLHIRLPGYCII